MEKLRHVIDRTLEVLLSILLVAMVLVALWAVFSRHLLNNPASFTTEFLTYALLWLSLLSAAYVFGQKGHLAITFIKDKFKGKGLVTVSVVTELIIIFFAVAVLIIGGMRGVTMGMGETLPTLNIAIGYVYLALPISGVFIILYSLLNMGDHIQGKGIDGEDEATTSTM